MLERATVSLRRGDKDEALKILEKAVEFAPSGVDAHHQRGIILRDMERWEEAKDEFEKAVQLEPDSSYHLYPLARTLAILERWSEFEEIEKRIIKMDVYSLRPYIDLIKRYIKTGRFIKASELAIFAFGRAIRRIYNSYVVFYKINHRKTGKKMV
jgi:tetratricopeptide (TPR) repeat protein